MLNAGEFAKWCKKQADDKNGYIMATIGQDPKKLNAWYFDQYRDNPKQYAKALEWREVCDRVFDCQGLADGYVTEKTGNYTNVRARNNYATWCGIRGSGEIPIDKKVPGAAVFMDNGQYISHVGFLVEPVNASRPHADWYVVEARGVMYGVVITKLSQRHWNRWGWMTKFFNYNDSDIPKDPGYGDRLLRRGCVGNDVACLQRDLIELKYSCGRYGADGEFGRSTESALKAFQHDNDLVADGVAGERTYAKLNELLPDDSDVEPPVEPEKTIEIQHGSSWNVRNQPNKQGAVLGYAHRGEKYAPSNETSEGWVGIIFNGENAWISGKAVL